MQVIFENVGTEGNDSMDAALTALDDQYAEWLVNRQNPTVPITCGADLERAMLAGVDWDLFLEESSK